MLTVRRTSVSTSPVLGCDGGCIRVLLLTGIVSNLLAAAPAPSALLADPQVITVFRPGKTADNPAIAKLVVDRIKAAIGQELYGMLKGYQKDGLRDIMASYIFDVPQGTCRGLFLADGPGIGKTLQAFCAAATAVDYATVAPATLGSAALILVPPNLLKSSWQEEINNKWMRCVPRASQLRPVFIMNIQAARTMVSYSIGKYDVVFVASSVLTHYHGRSKGAAANRGLPEFMRRRWALVAVDEAHTFKSDKSVRQQMLQELCSPELSNFNLFLSGTPLLNESKDMLGLSALITGDGLPLPNVDAVRDGGFMLRRIWAENSPGISKVQTTMMPVVLGAFERKAYDLLVELGKQDSDAAAGNGIVRLNLLTKLRQFVDDPRLLYESIRQRRERDIASGGRSSSSGPPATKRQRTQWLSDNVGDGPDLPTGTEGAVSQFINFSVIYNSQ
jgi:SNF2 family DNA or RNA helicase